MDFWPRTPKEVLERWMESTRNLQFLEKGPDVLDAWLKSQRDVLEGWEKSQKDFLETWMESTRNFQKIFLDMANLREGSEASTLFNSWFSTFIQSCRTMTDEMKNIMDTWGNTVEKQLDTNAEMVKKLFEIIRHEREKD
ncbi:MAG TPA: hypothetical protein VEI46_08010 [Thermodesulfovibrionales bacterium]|nr:hypothetical protein [Thermodesulfovibrionales bacterium]